ncbi:MAG: hypothetical protein ACFFCW_37590 [Candidatus Hodarchaeota archaeon]
MDKIVFGDFTVLDLLITAGVLVGALILFSILRKIFRKEQSSAHVQFAQCKNCDWQGKVSRYAGRCPKCNQPLGDQEAQTNQ